MKGNRLTVLGLGLFVYGIAFSQTKIDQKVIYKWTNQGLVYYSYIKPTGVEDYIKLDSRGRKVEELSEDFDEIVEIAVHPTFNEETMLETNRPLVPGSSEVEASLDVARETKVRQQNCETARKNLAKINGGEVYEPDSQGNMIRLTPAQIESKRSNVVKDVEYFCDQE